MTSTPLGLNLAQLRPAVPYLTGALHTLGAFSSLYFLLTPVEGAKLFGTPFRDSTSPTASELAFARMHGIRDLATAAAGLGLLSYTYILKSEGNLPAAKLVGQTLAGILFAGTAFALGDGWICSEYAKHPDVKKAHKEFAQSSVASHIVVSVPVALLGWAWLYY